MVTGWRGPGDGWSEVGQWKVHLFILFTLNKENEISKLSYDYDYQHLLFAMFKIILLVFFGHGVLCSNFQ